MLAILKSADHDWHVSVATLWECAIKSAIGKLDIPAGFHQTVADGYHTLGIEAAHLEAMWGFGNMSESCLRGERGVSR